ncbi:MAG TPA: hypothetical protein VJ302_04925 [Blastocatellia bacterium]|nr:hypothetical protein [Blastocatellia bacterium]
MKKKKTIGELITEIKELERKLVEARADAAAQQKTIEGLIRYIQQLETELETLRKEKQ